MTHIGVRSSRALLGALLAVLGLMWFAGQANAGFDTGSGSTVSIDSSTNWWNGTTVRSYGGYQYVLFWDAADARGNVYLKLVRRDLSSGTLESIIFDGTGGTSAQALVNLNDGHDTAQVGLSPVDGRIHLSWSVHHNLHHYGLSSSGCLSQARLSSCTWDWSRQMTTAVDRPTNTTSGTTTATENVMTYPVFFNDADGNLYFVYRFGESFRGNVWLNRYNNDGTWTSVGLIIKGRYETIDWSGGSGTCDSRGNTSNPSVACHRGVYIAGMQFDNHNRLHVMWQYKEYASGLDANGLRGIYYMYSDDFGRTWYNSAGTQVATANSNPLLPDSTASASVKVYDDPFGTWPEITYMTLDAKNEPHLVMPQSDAIQPDGQLVNQRLIHIWRTGTNTWHNSWVEPTGLGPNFPFGSLVFDGADNAYYVYNRNDLDWWPYNSDSFVQAQLPLSNFTWQGGDYLNVVPASAVTALDTVNYINTPIATGSGNNNTVTVSMKNNTVGTSFDLYWTTDRSTAFSVGKSQSFRISANDTRYQTYTFTVTDADWRDTLRALEIYPAGNSDVSGAGKDISIDYIRIGDDRGNYAKRWEFQRGNIIKLASSSADDNYSSWSIGDLLPSVNDAMEDSVASIDTARYKAAGVWDFPVTAQGSPGTDGIDIHEFPMTGDTTIRTWAFPVDEQGWTNDGTMPRFGWADDGGVLGVGGTLTTSGSAMNSDTYLNLPVTSSNTVTVRLKNTTTATQARLWFITYSNRTWLSTKTRTVTITPNSGYTNYTFDMSRVSGWNGSTIYQMALEPAVGATSGSFAVDSLSVNR